MSIYAHSANSSGKRQELADHLNGVARLGYQMGRPFNADDLVRLAGLWHDAGKADPQWQQRLLQCEEGTRDRIGIDHKCAGALIAEGAGGELALLAGMMIQGHHGGLRSRQGFKDWLTEKKCLPGPQAALSKLKLVMPDIENQPAPMLPDIIKRDPLAAEFYLRVAYSALVDADSLDTEAHKLGNTTTMFRANHVTPSDLWDRYQAFLDRQPEPDESDVNTVRRAVHDACLAAAEEPQGVYRLTVPTGGGKTRSGMAFALRHCVRHGLRRVIVAVPFTSITQQTAAVYREIFDDSRVVLEHHSATHFADQCDSEDSFAADAVWARLAAENWDAPVVVTTTVQLFESLFSNRRARTRKLHNLAESVIILDEAQALPIRLLTPILSTLRQLVELGGTTVVLSTATQPAFDLIPEFAATKAREIVPSHADHFRQLKRVRYEWRDDTASDWEEIAALMTREPQVLAVVNTKRHARELLNEIKQQLPGADAPEDGIVHLSTLLCGAHREAALNKIRTRLAAGEPCRVVSTQVVEAGVDLDFPVVLRAEAPLDSVIQAAGRCNREGHLGREGGQVIVFRPPDDASPGGQYRTGTDLSRVVRAIARLDPDDPETARHYYRLLFDSADTDEAGIQHLRTRMDFPAVADAFRMIDDDTCDVLVNYPDIETADRLAGMLRDRSIPPRESLRAAQPHTVSLRRREYDRLLTAGLIEPIRPFRDVGRWTGSYDPVGGMSETDPEMVY